MKRKIVIALVIIFAFLNMKDNVYASYTLKSDDSENNKVLDIDSKDTIYSAIKTNTYPVLEKVNNIPIINVDDMIGIEELRSYFKSNDYEDGDISSLIKISTSYNPVLKIAGEYNLAVSVTDSDNNTTTINTMLVVVDNSAPIVKNTSIKLYNDKCYNYNEIFDYLNVVDNSDSLLTFKTLDDGYTLNYKTPGTYYIDYLISDGSNENETNIEIIVVDVIKPIVTLDNLTTSTKKRLLDEDFINSIKVIDDSMYTVKINRDDYDKYYNKKGCYKVTFFVEDIFKNETNAEILVTVIEYRIPMIYSNNRIKIYNDNILSQSDLISLYKKIRNYNDIHTTTVVESDYFKDPTREGEFSVLITTIDSKGEEEKESFILEVGKAVCIREKKITISKIKEFIIILFKAIRKLLKKIFGY